MPHLKPRPTYLNKLINFKNTEFIKVIVGMRRCGKSSLLELFNYYLIESNISSNQIIKINFEAAEFLNINDYQSLLDYVLPKIENASEKKMHYLLLDEIQLVDNWERAINALRVRDGVDIYITGSNANMLSSQLSTLLSGRYVEVNVFPLSFSEYVFFAEEKETVDNLFQRYMLYGGLPPVVEQGNNHDLANVVLSGIYNTIVVKDIAQHIQIRNQSVFNDIARFLADTSGSRVSVTNIENHLTSAHRKTANETIEKYIKALVDAFLFYQAKRYDVKGGAILRGLDKYYPSDLGIRNMLLGFPQRNYGFVLENIIHNELVTRGYSVEVGKFDNLEIDFVAHNAEESIYVQACATLLDEDTRTREFLPFKKLTNTNSRKLIVTFDRMGLGFYDGVEVVNAINWLLGK